MKNLVIEYLNQNICEACIDLKFGNKRYVLNLWKKMVYADLGVKPNKIDLEEAFEHFNKFDTRENIS